MADCGRTEGNKRVIASKRYQDEIKKWLGKRAWGWFEDADPKKCSGFDYGIVTAVLDTGEEDHPFVYEITGITIGHGRFLEEERQGLRPAFYMINDFDEEVDSIELKKRGKVNNRYEVNTYRCNWIAENIWPLHEDEYTDGK